MPAGSIFGSVWLIFWLIIGKIVVSIYDKVKISQLPLLSDHVIVIATPVEFETSVAGDDNTETTTYYYGVVFKFSDGSERKFYFRRKEHDKYNIGDTGVMRYKHYTAENQIVFVDFQK